MCKRYVHAEKPTSDHYLTEMQRERQTAPELVSVCVCTYKRTHLLVKSLEGLIAQKTDGRFTFSIVIVDNDPKRSAQRIVEEFAAHYPLEIKYYNQPKVGLSYARNMALEHCAGEYVAIIDDDEVPEPQWLLSLYTTLHAYEANAVFGSVLPVFEVEPPRWVVENKVFYWRDERGKTGTPVAKGATNNVLFRKQVVDIWNLRFDPFFAYTGGCDEDFFRRLKRKAGKFVACAEAVVHEYFPADRCTLPYIRKRNILEGCALVRIIRREKNYPLFICRFFQAWLTLLLTALGYPFLFALGKGVRANRYFSGCFHAGVLLEMFHLSPYKDRKSIGLQGE